MDEDQLINEVFELAQTEEIAKLADEAITNFKKNKTILELKETEIFDVLKASYIAERFFGKSRYWISQKINHNLKNGKPADFTEKERETLKNAIETIAFELQELADNM